MKNINNYSLIEVKGYSLYIELINKEEKYSLVGILKNGEETIEYCETVNISDYEDALKLFNVLNENSVFPSHFNDIIDDIFI